jgi:hypothetical protein
MFKEMVMDWSVNAKILDGTVLNDSGCFLSGSVSIVVTVIASLMLIKDLFPSNSAGIYINFLNRTLSSPKADTETMRALLLCFCFWASSDSML